MAEAPKWDIPTASSPEAEQEAPAVALKLDDFWIHEATFLYKPTIVVGIHSGKMYLFYGDSNAGKTYVAGTWYDHECADCHVKIGSPQKGTLTKCPACGSENLSPRPIVMVDFELGRAEMMKREQFPNKKILITEPRVLNPEYNPLSDDDATDVIATEENYVNFLMTILRAIQNGEILPSAIVTDSATEVWSIIQEWGFQELIRANPKYTKSNATMMRTEIQTDWKVMNNRHFKLIQICRAIMRYGVDIIWTARYDGPPSYVKDGTQKIRAQKDVSFYSDIRVHMEHRVIDGPTKRNIFTSHIEKLGSLEAPAESFDRLSYVKIQQIYSKKKKELEESLSEEAEYCQVDE